jgi:large subunit ribosomal protein L5
MARLFDFYKSTVVGELTKKFGYKSVMEVPRITKITLNMGVGGWGVRGDHGAFV